MSWKIPVDIIVEDMSDDKFDDLIEELLRRIKGCTNVLYVDTGVIVECEEEDED